MKARVSAGVLFCALAAAGCGGGGGAPTAASVQSCMQKDGFNVDPQPLTSDLKSMGYTAIFDVRTRPGEIHDVEFWKSSKDAARYIADSATDSRHPRAFGMITITDPSTPDAQKIEKCFR